MERIAIISDIHANVVALEAVLEDIGKRKIDRIFCLGDIVLKGASPCEVVDIVRKKCEIVVKGNCDDLVVKASEGRGSRKVGGDASKDSKNVEAEREKMRKDKLIDIQETEACPGDELMKLYRRNPEELRKNVFFSKTSIKFF